MPFVPPQPDSPTQIGTQFGPDITSPPDRHVRRGQEEYAHALQALLPQGIAWPRFPDTVLMRVVYGLAGIMGWCDGRAADLLERESDPRQTVEMLDWWERAWQPFPCDAPNPATIGERQTKLVMWMTLLGGQSRQFFIDAAARMGYGITISEYRPFMVGIDACGDNRTINPDGSFSEWPCQIGPPDMRFVWTVHVHETKLVWFRAGAGEAGVDPHLQIGLATDLECMIRMWRPAQTTVLFDYSGVSPPDPEAGLP
jgi:uncharacterized protein YmfQ (DUF2313 family)